MRIYILDPEGEAIDYSAEQLPARWRDAVRNVANESGVRDSIDLTMGEIGEVVSVFGPMEDSEILRAYTKWNQGNPYVIEEGHRVDALDFIKRSCMAAWLFNPTILRDFDRRCYMTDGYAKILADRIEYGWLLHDGLNRMIL